jgi:hypothetical protein
MVTPKNIRFLAAGVAIGFILAFLLLMPSAETPSQTGPKMSIVMNMTNLPAQTLQKIAIPAGPIKGMLPIKLSIQSIGGEESEIDRAIRRAARQKYHLIYRENGPID